MATTAYAIKALAKHGRVEKTAHGYHCTIGRHVVSFHDQAGSAICINVRRVGDVDDYQSDYFAGSYARNIAQAIAWATEGN